MKHCPGPPRISPALIRFFVDVVLCSPSIGYWVMHRPSYIHHIRQELSCRPGYAPPQFLQPTHDLDIALGLGPILLQADINCVQEYPDICGPLAYFFAIFQAVLLSITSLLCFCALTPHFEFVWFSESTVMIGNFNQLSRPVALALITCNQTNHNAPSFM